MAASAIYLLDSKGHILISRNYRGDVDNSAVDKFITYLNDGEDGGDVRPVVEIDGITYVSVAHKDVYLLALTRRNVNVAMLLVYLHRMIHMFEEYFKQIEVESVRDNFVVIYELFDEIMDFGYPQSTDTNILSKYITVESQKLTSEQEAPSIPPSLTTWRPEGIKHKKNEVFLDVIESVNLLANSNGQILRSDVSGVVRMRVFLTGMPELKLGLNDKLPVDSGRSKSRTVEMEDMKYHQCVQLDKLEKDRCVTFIPPDGEFDLMSYRLNVKSKPLIWVDAQVERHSHSRVEYIIKAKSDFNARSSAKTVEIVVPVPKDADTPSFKATKGTVRYAPEQDALIWSIKNFPGGQQYGMRAHFGLPSLGSDDASVDKPPISVNFVVPYFTVSGLQVRYLKVTEKSGYSSMPWVRYISQNGEYHIRMPST